MTLSNLSTLASNLKSTHRLPAMFIGHGNPMNAILDNKFTQSLSKFANGIDEIQAILVVSAHWETNGVQVSSSKIPETIYDFGGFPDELYKVKYPAPGSPEYAKVVADVLKENHTSLDPNMGLDHGAWTILKHIFPKANIPVFQLSLNVNYSPAQHFELAKKLSGLREKGVLIIGSGNIVHNLRRINWRDANPSPFDWAMEFDAYFEKALLSNDNESLIHYNKIGESAKLAVPTNEHYLPALYIKAVQTPKDNVSIIYQSFEMGSLSMKCFKIS